MILSSKYMTKYKARSIELRRNTIHIIINNNAIVYRVFQVVKKVVLKKDHFRCRHNTRTLLI